MINKIFAGVLVLILVHSCNEPTKKAQMTEASDDMIAYDSALAAKVGADAYGMRQYVMANLIAGPNRDQDSTTAAQLQRAHLDNITRMAEEGKLVLAGPFMDDGDVRGIYVFAVETIEEAEELTKSDPAIQAGRLRMELRPWYGSAALMLLNDWHEKVSQEGI
ncbi:YciI family protein [Marinoscillum sp.]|uniref:YciI family protein n=1 Tax=Marinoscillum sp. TaxID=2024838 RepID=UPI003BAD3B72